MYYLCTHKPIITIMKTQFEGKMLELVSMIAELLDKEVLLQKQYIKENLIIYKGTEEDFLRNGDNFFTERDTIIDNMKVRYEIDFNLSGDIEKISVDSHHIIFDVFHHLGIINNFEVELL